MTLSLKDIKGCSLDKQRFTWRALVQQPISKLDDDAFTRVRIILLDGLELEAQRFQHACARMNGDLQKDTFPGDMTFAEVRLQRDEEAGHYALLVEAIEQMGGDPTTQTPCADMTAVQSMGLMQAKLVQRFSEALTTEQRHAENVRSWLSEALSASALSN